MPIFKAFPQTEQTFDGIDGTPKILQDERQLRELIDNNRSIEAVYSGQ